jgi:hypothetical protein
MLKIPFMRTMNDPGCPYAFISAERLLVDFFEAPNEITMICMEAD